MAKKNTKEKIFDVSIDLFSQYGYDGVSIRQIAKEVGIKESSIYNHYQSKESILESILSYYINEMLKEEAPVMQPKENLNMDFDHFYKEGSDRFISKLSEEKMMKITRIFLVESYHNEKIKKFVKEAIIGYAINGWEDLFNLMKEMNFIKKDADIKQLAESFYYYGLFLLYEHFIINYPEDDEKFLIDFKRRTTNHMKILFNSVKIDAKDKGKDYDLKNRENDESYNKTIRLEEEKDYLKVENLVRDAFWNVYRPGAYEHYIVHNLRDDSSFIKDLAYIIEGNDEIIGHINYSNGRLNLYKENRYGVDIKVSEGSGKATVLGPIAIDSKYQSNGYGSKLIRHTLKLAEDMNIPFIFVIGDEEYYSRFGFESASKYNIYLEETDTEDENPFFMIKILNGNENTLKNLDYDKGIFYNPEVFDVDEKMVDEFDENFEYKEKKVLEGQLDI
ncbi:MAG: GNAT family N-acetyltransferase [Methanobrevibacter ruminantium]|uniref:GNAT family N-acetyltransferase n=1 Tax=Methanobrevibacter ruminantium TaxID=83816 RepID=UPI0026E9AAC4|nr:GNAT family N-acetyltransferase [Methanobrevibacter ruminantium]MCI5736430.1 GNAT family N-acetyltransferase [Methanobrevibacter ruminantium]MDD6048996.1 GNAT family N-acetyltransferase [Methanobrevibacter ruminantium]